MKKLVNLLTIMTLFCLSQILFAAALHTTQDQQTILDEINQYRLAHHLQPLKINKNISLVAEKHSSNMSHGNIPFGHVGFNNRTNQLFAQISKPQAIAENVAYGNLDAKKVVQLWLNSEGHRRNIEGNYNLTGIGITYNDDGLAYYTQIFIRTQS
jgi:uncharacterized protein YkwD